MDVELVRDAPDRAQPGTRRARGGETIPQARFGVAHTRPSVDRQQLDARGLVRAANEQLTGQRMLGQVRRQLGGNERSSPLIRSSEPDVGREPAGQASGCRYLAGVVDRQSLLHAEGSLDWTGRPVRASSNG